MSLMIWRRCGFIWLNHVEVVKFQQNSRRLVGQCWPTWWWGSFSFHHWLRRESLRNPSTRTFWRTFVVCRPPTLWWVGSMSWSFRDTTLTSSSCLPSQRSQNKYLYFNCRVVCPLGPDPIRVRVGQKGKIQARISLTPAILQGRMAHHLLLCCAPFRIEGKVSFTNCCKPTFPYLPSNRAPFNVVKNAIVKLRGNTAIPQRLGAVAPLLTSFWAPEDRIQLSLRNRAKIFFGSQCWSKTPLILLVF